MASSPTPPPPSPSRSSGSPRARRRALLEKAKSWLPTAVFLVCVLCARASLADHYVVPTGSMEPTVRVGDRIVVNKAAFGLRVPLTDFRPFGLTPPERGDVVVIEPPTGEGPVLLKRVVALAGDEVEVRRGRLRLNGASVPIRPSTEGAIEQLGRPHKIQLSHGGGRDFGPSVVPSGHMLVVGDNRGNSLDGRSFGYVSMDTCLGRAHAVYRQDGEWTWQPL